MISTTDRELETGSMGQSAQIETLVKIVSFSSIRYTFSYAKLRIVASLDREIGRLSSFLYSRRHAVKRFFSSLSTQSSAPSFCWIGSAVNRRSLKNGDTSSTTLNSRGMLHGLLSMTSKPASLHLFSSSLSN